MTLNKRVNQTVAEIRDDLTSQEEVYVDPSTQTPLSINDVLQAVAKLGEKRDYVIKSIIAVYLSTFIEKRDPLWLMIVGNPSSNKTTLVDLLEPLADVYRLDTMTSNPFSSGQKEKDNPKDLLPLLDEKCFVIKEYGALLGKNDEVVKQLIGDLVAIYDGEYSKHSPTRGTVRYKVYFSHIGCVTPMALNRRQRYMSAIGARFILLRLDSLSEEDRKDSLTKIWDSTQQADKLGIAAIVSRFCNQLKDKVLEGGGIQFTEEVKERLNRMALITARARGIVITEKTRFKSEEGVEISHYEPMDIQVEEPFRALKQLKKFAQCLAYVNGNSCVGEEELGIVRRLSISSMPTRRAKVLSVYNHGQVFTARTASEVLKMNQRTVKRNLDELVALDVLQSDKLNNQLARTYYLKADFRDLFKTPELSESDIATLFNAHEV